MKCREGGCARIARKGLSVKTSFDGLSPKSVWFINWLGVR